MCGFSWRQNQGGAEESGFKRDRAFPKGSSKSDIELFVNNIFYVFMLLAWSDPSGLGAVPRRRWQHRQVIEMTKN